MKRLGRFVPVAAAALLAAAAACGGDSTGTGPQAASVTGIAGDSQTAPTGATLAFPLSFVALSSSGQPAQGVHVTWSAIPASAATFTPATSATDVNGGASTTATLGAFVGDVTIHAAVSGVSDVVYHATALDPCLYLTPYTVGDLVNASLVTTDCRRTFQGITFYYDFYGFTLPAGTQSVRLSMKGTTPAFDDTYLDFFRGSDGQFVAFDDDSVLGVSGARNSQLDIILPGGDYITGASSFDPFTTGPYTLKGIARPVAMNGCRQVWLARGVSVSDSVTLSDCADSAATPHHYDVARMVLFAGTALSIAERSSVINPSLAIYRLHPEQAYARVLAVSNDDSSAGNSNAFIKWTVDTTGYYDILIGASAGGEVGAYTLAVSADTTLSASAAVARARRRDLWDVLGFSRPVKH